MSKRILQVNELIKEELGKIILQEIEFPKNFLITITRVETASNLKQAFVYISTIGVKEEDEKEAFSILEKNIYRTQKELNRKLNMRPVPKIIFKQEKETKKAAIVEGLLEKIKKK